MSRSAFDAYTDRLFNSEFWEDLQTSNMKIWVSIQIWLISW